LALVPGRSLASALERIGSRAAGRQPEMATRLRAIIEADSNR
jgi:hypothetical protein